MAEPIVRGTMELTEFLRLRKDYEQKAVIRKSERLNLGMYDSTWDDMVRDEIEIGLILENRELRRRLGALEEMILGDESKG